MVMSNIEETVIFFVREFENKYARLIPEELLQLQCILAQLKYKKMFKNDFFEDEIKEVKGKMYIETVHTLYQMIKEEKSKDYTDIFFYNKSDEKRFENNDDFKREIYTLYDSYNEKDIARDIEATKRLIAKYKSEVD